MLVGGDRDLVAGPLVSLSLRSISKGLLRGLRQQAPGISQGGALRNLRGCPISDPAFRGPEHYWKIVLP